MIYRALQTRADSARTFSAQFHLDQLPEVSPLATVSARLATRETLHATVHIDFGA
jgi:hypothetical protein